MERNKLKRKKARRRALSVRNRLRASGTRVRLSVHRTSRHISAQIIDDEKQVTLAGVSTVGKSADKNAGNVEGAKVIGQKIAELAKEKGITEVAFDRGPYRYHGRVKALAEAAREAGLKF